MSAFIYITFRSTLAMKNEYIFYTIFLFQKKGIQIFVVFLISQIHPSMLHKSRENAFLYKIFIR